MEEILDEVKSINNYSEKEVFTKIWIEPRKVFEFIHETYYEKYMILLMLLGGIHNTIGRASTIGLIYKGNVWLNLFLVILFGLLFGWIGFYFFGALVSLTGKWLKGTAGVKEIVRISVYAAIPLILGIIVFFLQFFVIKSVFPISNLIVYNFLIYFFLFIDFILALWSLVLTVIGIAVVQNFSIAKAILNMLLPIFILIAIFLPIRLLIN